MSLPPTTAALIGSIAHSSDAHPNLTAIDRAGFDPKYLEAGPGREVVSAAISLHRQGKAPNLLNVMAMVGQKVTKADWLPIVKIWQNGYGDVDPQLAVQAARQDYKVRETRRLHADLERSMTNNPAGVDTWLPDLEAQLRSLNDIGAVYDARPSAIYRDDIPAILFPLRIAQLNDLLRGGVRSGMMVIVCGISGHGKSTLFYTLAVECLILGRPVVFINNENSRRKVLNRILRGVTRMTEAEIDTRKGNTPERQHVLDSWLKHADIYLRIYEAQHYNTREMERIVRNDKPEAVIVDYLREVPGMVPTTGRSEAGQAIGGMSYWMLESCNSNGYSMFTGAQMSDKAAEEFKSNDEAVPELAYGTKMPYFATDIWIAQKRDNLHDNMSYDRVAKDRIANNLMSEHRLPFDTKTWIYTGDLDNGDVDVA